MEIKKLENFTKGWVVGDFLPSVIRTKDFEFAVQNFKTGQRDVKHVHKVATEVTVVVSGKFRLNEIDLSAGDVVTILPGEVSEFECVAEGSTAVVKTPSVVGDKFLI